MKKTIILFSLLCLLFVSPTARSATTSITITEVGAFESSGHEWVELFNASDAPIDLAAWSFWENEVNHGLSHAHGSAVIEPGSFAVIAQDASSTLSDYPFLSDITIFDSAWDSLKESGETIGLRDDAGTLIEEVSYTTGTDFSIERHLENDIFVAQWTEHASSSTIGKVNSIWNIQGPAPTYTTPTPAFSHPATSSVNHPILFDATSSTDPDNIVTAYQWHFGDGSTGTGVTTTHSYSTTGTQEISLTLFSNVASSTVTTSSILILNPVPTNTAPAHPTSSIDIILNEVVSTPTNGPEWVELFNTGTTTVDLSSWTLHDGVGLVATVSGTIDGLGYLVVELSSQKLNNGGDLILLYDTAGKEMDRLSYGSWASSTVAASVAGESLIRNPNGSSSALWHITQTVTKGEENVLTEKEQSSTSSSNNNASSNNSSSHTETSSDKPATPASALKNLLFINEIYPNPPGADTEDEFIELYYAGTTALEIRDVRLGDATAKRYKLPDQTLEPNHYYVFYRPGTNISLNNSGGDAVVLEDDGGAVIDSVSYITSPEGESTARTDSGGFAWTTTPTPGEQNIFTTPTEEDDTDEVISAGEERVTEREPYCNCIALSEFLPDPVGTEETEFIELRNTSNGRVSLAGLQLDDAAGGSSPFTFTDEVIEKNGLIVVWREKSKLALNNSDDAVRLLDADGSVIWSWEYGETDEGVAGAIVHDSLQWTTTPTPGNENIITAELLASATSEATTTEVPTVERRAIAEVEDGDMVTVTGTVVAVPGLLGSQYFILGPEPGIQIYSSKKTFPPLSLGDTIAVTGEISDTTSGRRINIKEAAAIEFLESTTIHVAPTSTIQSLTPNDHYSIVQLTGDITEIKKNSIWIDDGTGEIEIQIKAAAEIHLTQYSLGQTVAITGIILVNQDGIALVPREEVDIALVADIGEEPVPPPTTTIALKGTEHTDNAQALLYGITTTAGFALLLSILLYKNRQLIAEQWQKLKDRYSKADDLNNE